MSDTITIPRPGLLSADAWPHPVRQLRIIETHISVVVLTGDWAYKLKKNVNLGFLDFSTLALRKAACEEEVRLNRRTAPELYLDVVAITGTPDRPRVGGDGVAIEYAVRMRQFSPDATLDQVLARGVVRSDHVDALADAIVAFHARAAPAGPESSWGTAQVARNQVLATFAPLERTLSTADATVLHALHTWVEHEHGEVAPLIEARRAAGFVRECHGDLHLANVALIDDRPVPFDCIEFNPALRWIDVASEVAFTFMDLVDRDASGLAWRFVNRWLEGSGDYGAVRLLPFFAVYRALVRAQVAALRAEQLAQAGHDDGPARCDAVRHVMLARRLAAPRPRRLVLTHGLSGSGKTAVSQVLLEALGAVRLRADVERKRLHGLRPTDRPETEVDAGIYTREASDRTYGHLATQAAVALEAGIPVIVDATFLRRGERDRFAALAGLHKVPLTVVACDAPPDVLRNRLDVRQRAGADASDADVRVLEQQLRSYVPLGENELAAVIRVDTSRSLADVVITAREIAAALSGERPVTCEASPAAPAGQPRSH